MHLLISSGFFFHFFCINPGFPRLIVFPDVSMDCHDHVPAVNHGWSSFGFVERFEMSSECQDLCWIERNTVIWP